MTKSKKVVYASRVNLVGLHSPTPVRCTWRPGLHDWWDKEGDFCVRKLGVDAQVGAVTYASLSKKEVECWVQGVEAAMSMLRAWAGAKTDEDQ